MNYEDLTPEQKEIWDFAFAAGTEAEEGDSWAEAYNEGFADGEEEGYSQGYHNGKDEAYQSGYFEGKEDGIKAEQDRIQYILNMMFESALNMGQGNKAVQYKHAMDLLKPIKFNPDLVDEDF